MKKLSENVYIDADENSFTLYEEGVIVKKDSKNVGKKTMRPIGYYSTYEQVSKKIAEIGVKEYIDKDWLQCVDFVNEAHTNFLKNVEELLEKRYDRKTDK